MLDPIRGLGLNQSLLDGAEAVDNASLHYQVELDLEHAVAFLEKCDPSLVGMVKELDAIVPTAKWGTDKAEKFYNFLIGKEYSRVIYLDINTSYYVSEPFDEDELMEKMQEIVERYNANEINRIDSNMHLSLGFTMRFWWD